MSSGRAIANPTRRPGDRVGLAHRARDDQARVALAERQLALAAELDVRLVEQHDRRRADRRPAASSSRPASSDSMTPAGSVVAVGLFGLHSQMRLIGGSAPRGRAAANGLDVQREPGLQRPPRHPHDLRAALLGEDRVHRVGRDGHQGRAAVGDERLGDEVEDLVRARADEQLLARDLVPRGRRVDQPAVVGRRVLRQGDLEPARPRAARDDPPGGLGAVFWSKRTTCSIGRP